ncbi:MAG: 50S ribosomal protein L30e [Candidatus Micrarchaeia archaeon]
MNMVDFAKAIRMAVDSGKVEFGARRSLKLALHGKPKLLILAANAPRALRASLEGKAKAAGVPVKIYGGSSLELGSVCGKPHPVLALSILEPGNSPILETL